MARGSATPTERTLTPNAHSSTPRSPSLSLTHPQAGLPASAAVARATTRAAAAATAARVSSSRATMVTRPVGCCRLTCRVSTDSIVSSSCQRHSDGRLAAIGARTALMSLWVRPSFDCKKGSVLSQLLAMCVYTKASPIVSERTRSTRPVTGAGTWWARSAASAAVPSRRVEGVS